MATAGGAQPCPAAPGAGAGPWSGALLV
jgi:hypothetical protein